MINIVDFKDEHEFLLTKQIEQSEAMGLKGRTGKTIFINGDICCCIGSIEIWEGRIRIWSVIDRNVGKHMVLFIRTLKRLLKVYETTRVEIDVKTTFRQGHRLAKILGFKKEGTMKKYWNNLDFDLYAKVVE